jgi:HK97 family phage major capsid protein
LDHDTRTQVGRVEGLRLDGDRVMRGTPRFSRSALGREVEQDVRDGIRTDVSVGYRILEAIKEGERDGVEVYRVSRWQPAEISLVATPADPTVGIGRNATEGAEPVIIVTLDEPPQTGQESMRMSNLDTAAPTAHPAPTMQDALNVAKRLGVPDAERADWAGNGMEPQKIMDSAVAYVERKTTEQVANAKGVELTDREQRSYSVVRAIQGLLSGRRDGIEFELSDELAKRLGKTTNGFFMPTTIRAQHPEYRVDPRLMSRTQLNVGTGSKGGNLVYTEHGGFVDLLRNYAAIFDLGATYMPGLQGNLQFVRQTGAGTAYWGTEASASTATSLALGTFSMTPKVLTAKHPYTKMLLNQSVESIENLIRNDIAREHALAIDYAGIKGDTTTDAPDGILSVAAISTAVTGGAQGAAPDWDDIVDLQKALAAANGLRGALAYLTTPGVAAKLMKTQKFATTNGAPVWDGPMLDGSLGGFRAVASNQVPSTGTKGTTTGQHSIIFGNWNDLLVGEWGAIEIYPDIYTSGPQIVNINSIQFVDVGLRRTTASFAAMVDALP